MSAEVTYVTALDAATRAGEWLKEADKNYLQARANGRDPDPAVEAALAQGWATLAVALS